MKLKFLLLIPLLLISGCSVSEEHYYNVEINYSQEENVFYCYPTLEFSPVTRENNNKYYIVEVENVNVKVVQKYDLRDVNGYKVATTNELLVFGFKNTLTKYVLCETIHGYY